jgi:membrane-bound ClpP family serine protease
MSLLAHDVPPLVKAEIDLAKLEAKEAAKAVGTRAGLVSASVYASMVGVFFLCCGLAFLISEVLERAWAGPLIVGGGLVILALVFLPFALRRPKLARS